MIEKFSKNLIPISIIVAGLVIAGALVYLNQNRGTILSSKEVGDKVINFINKNIPLAGNAASLISIAEEGSVYKIRLKMGDNEYDSYVSKDGKFLFPEGYDLEKVSEPQPEAKDTIGDFLISGEEICLENEKPIVYFFGSKSCPHCNWEHPIIEEVTAKFKENIVFHNNMDLEQDMGVFSKYSTGGIPTLVLGCKYYRVGSGESLGEETEVKVLTALICRLTNNQPSETCDSVQDLINQIE